MIIIPFSFPAGTFPRAYQNAVISHNFQKSFLDSFPPSPVTALFLCSPFAAEPNFKKILFLSSHSFLNLFHPSLLPYLFTEIALDKFTQSLHVAKSRTASVLSTSHRCWTQVSTPSCLTHSLAPLHISVPGAGIYSLPTPTPLVMYPVPRP